MFSKCIRAICQITHMFVLRLRINYKRKIMINDRILFFSGDVFWYFVPKVVCQTLVINNARKEMLFYFFLKDRCPNRCSILICTSQNSRKCPTYTHTFTFQVQFASDLALALLTLEKSDGKLTKVFSALL